MILQQYFLKIKGKQEFFLYLVLFISIVVGIIIRLQGLGKWPLAVDEYYIVKSSENILKYGLPQWDAGGHYMRGLPQQYLTAFLLILGLKAEFASRIIPLLSNLLAIPGLYLLGKKISGKTLAAALVFIFTFSVWEVEFARFARMYTMFQAIFIWYLYFLYKFIFEDDSKALKWLWTLSFFSIFVYEASIFLVLLNFMPLFWERKSQSFNLFSIENYKSHSIKFITCIFIFIFAYAFLTFNFRTLFQHNLLPPDVIEYYKSLKSTGIIRIPLLLIKTTYANPLWLLLTSVLLLVNLFIFYKIFSLRKSIPMLTACGLLLIFSFLNLLGLFIVLTVIFLMLGWLELDDLKIMGKKTEGGGWPFFPSKVIRFLILAASINIIFWVIFALKTETWHQFYPHQNISGIILGLKLIFKNSLNYPYLYETYVLFRDTIPLATAIYLFLIGILFLYVLRNYYDNDNRKIKFLIFLLMFLVLTQNILKLTYFDTRHFFFLYPLILLLSILSIERISNFIRQKSIGKVVFSLAFIPILIGSEDFEIKHFLSIDSKETNFRMNFSFPLTVHYYPRWDVETPSKIVNKESSSDDIIITNEHSVDYYLKRLDYIFKDFNGSDFKGESVLNGRKERWTDAKLIYKYSDLNQVIDNNHQRIWLLINNMWALDDLNFLIRKYDKYLYYSSIDGRILLFKITK